MEFISAALSPQNFSSLAVSSGPSAATLQSVAAVSLALPVLIFTPVSFFVAVGVLYLIASMFGGRGKYLERIYVTLLFGVPVVIVSDLLFLAPRVGGWLGYVPHVYSVILMILALVAVHRPIVGAN